MGKLNNKTKMFSKPILIAASVASAQAALLA